jgi:hypothetical protein
MLPPSKHRLTWESRRANDADGFALAAHPGQSRGRPSNEHGLEAHRPVNGLPVLRLLPDARDTNPCESMIECVRRSSRNVKRWQSGEMCLRWTAAGMLEAERQFKRIIGYHDLAKLALAVERDLNPQPTKEVAVTLA